MGVKPTPFRLCASIAEAGTDRTIENLLGLRFSVGNKIRGVVLGETKPSIFTLLCL